MEPGTWPPLTAIVWPVTRDPAGETSQSTQKTGPGCLPNESK